MNFLSPFMPKVLLHGRRLNGQIIKPFVRQIQAGGEDIEFWAAGLFEEDLHFADGQSRFGIEKCLSYSLEVTGNSRNEVSGKSSFSRIVSKITKRLSRFGEKEKWKQILSSIDVMHFHGLFACGFSNRLLDAVPTIPIVVSCWGSDVLRSHSPQILKAQQTLLFRAKAITVSSPEFREIVLAKYGQHLREKIVITQFSPTLEEVFSLNHQEASDNFRKRESLSTDKIIVGIAHNGHSENQHREILSGIHNLPRQIREKIHLLLPMTYGGSKEHRKSVEEQLEDSGFEYTILTEFLSEQEVGELRHAIDVFIYAPVSDAFSATVSQALAAGSECIIGSWLPYKTRIKAGFLYTEIDEPGQAGEALQDVVSTKLGDIGRQKHNRELSREFFNPEVLGKQWTNVYRKV